MNEVELLWLSGQQVERDKTDTVFLKVVEAGKIVTLYSYQDIMKIRFYVLERGDLVPDELIFKRALVGQSVKNLDLYKNRLTAIAIKSKKITEHVKQLIANADYYESDLSKIVAAINAEESENANPKKDSISTDYQKKSGSNFFAGLDMTATSLVYYGDVPLAYNASTTRTFLPTFYLGYDSWLNHHVGSAVFRVEASIGASRFNVTSGPNNFSDFASQDATRTNYSFSGQLLYNYYNSEELKMFAAIGAKINFASTITNTYTQRGGFLSTSDTSFPQLINFWLSLPMRVGIIVNRELEVSIGYQPYAMITNYYIFFGGRIATVELGLKCHF